MVKLWFVVGRGREGGLLFTIWPKHSCIFSGKLSFDKWICGLEAEFEYIWKFLSTLEQTETYEWINICIKILFEYIYINYWMIYLYKKWYKYIFSSFKPIKELGTILKMFENLDNLVTRDKTVHSVQLSFFKCSDWCNFSLINAEIYF